MTVTGEVDLASAPQYRRELHDAVAAELPLEIDLSECDLIDSVGLGVTIGAVRRATERNLDVRIVTSPMVMRLVKRCRLDEILPVVEPEVVLASTADSPLVEVPRP